MSYAAAGPAAPAGSPSGSSISQLVQQLQSGSISKQQLYSSLTHMYQSTPSASQQQPSSGGGSHSLLGTPSSNASIGTSFSLHTGGGSTTPASASHLQQFSSFQQQQPAAQQYHGAAPAAAAPAYSPQVQAAQQHIQSFLSKHLNNSTSGLNASNSFGISGLNTSDSLNLSLASQHSQQGQHNPNSSLNFSQSHNSAYGGGGGQQQQQPPAYFSPSQIGGYHGGGGAPQQYQQQQQQPSVYSNGGDTMTMQAMEDSMAMSHGAGDAQYQQQQYQQYQQQQQQQHQGGYNPYGEHPVPYNADESFYSQNGGDNGGYGEAEEYTGDNGRYFEQGGGGRVASARRSSSNTQRGHTARHSVRERMAQVYTDEKNKELTFHPTIAPMPKGLYAKSNRSASSAASAPFLGRVMHWQENKRARERQRAAELEKKALQECSFQPKLTPESVAIVDAPGASHRRLFSARSTARAKILELEVKRREEEEFKAHCTFEPSLNRKSLSLAESSAVRRPLTASSSERTLEATTGTAGAKPLGLSSRMEDEEECTFAPKVNEVKRGMKAAALYLEQNAFERLSSAKPQVQKDDGYNSDGGAGGKRGRSKSARGSSNKRSSSSDARTGSGDASASVPPGEDSSFGEFLARLKYKEYQRQERLAALKAEEQKQFQYGRPMLSKQSAKIVAKSMESGTYQSPAKHAVAYATAKAAGEATNDILPPGAVRGEHAAKREALARAQKTDPNCTFSPTINPYSHSLSRRSWHEMSTLEQVRRSHSLEMAASERLAAELEHASFTPHLHPRPKAHAQVDGRLKVVSEPDLYLERLEFQRRLKEAEVQRQRQVREAEETKECTFAPAVHESPAFVKRIANSLHAARGKEPVKKKQEKADWR